MIRRFVQGIVQSRGTYVLLLFLFVLAFAGSAYQASDVLFTSGKSQLTAQVNEGYEGGDEGTDPEDPYTPPEDYIPGEEDIPEYEEPNDPTGSDPTVDPGQTDIPPEDYVPPFDDTGIPEEGSVSAGDTGVTETDEGFAQIVSDRVDDSVRSVEITDLGVKVVYRCSDFCDVEPEVRNQSAYLDYIVQLLFNETNKTGLSVSSFSHETVEDNLRELQTTTGETGGASGFKYSLQSLREAWRSSETERTVSVSWRSGASEESGEILFVQDVPFVLLKRSVPGYGILHEYFTLIRDNRWLRISTADPEGFDRIVSVAFSGSSHYEDRIIISSGEGTTVAPEPLEPVTEFERIPEEPVQEETRDFEPLDDDGDDFVGNRFFDDEEDFFDDFENVDDIPEIEDEELLDEIDAIWSIDLQEGNQISGTPFDDLLRFDDFTEIEVTHAENTFAPRYIEEDESLVAEIDRLTDEILEERTLFEKRTNDLLADSDSDGVSDYDEIVIFGTNPFRETTGGGTQTDAEKILAGIDPVTDTPIIFEDPRAVPEPTISTYAVDTLTAGAPEEDAPLPLSFSGQALPNSFVTLYIFSTPIVVTVRTDEEGRWQYELTSELEDGSHDIYVATVDNSGKIIAKSDPIPFVKTANAAELSVVVATPQDSVGFLRSNFILIILGIAIVGVVIMIAVVGSDFRRGRRELIVEGNNDYENS